MDAAHRVHGRPRQEGDGHRPNRLRPRLQNAVDGLLQIQSGKLLSGKNLSQLAAEDRHGLLRHLLDGLRGDPPDVLLAYLREGPPDRRDSQQLLHAALAEELDQPVSSRDVLQECRQLEMLQPGIHRPGQDGGHPRRVAVHGASLLVLHTTVLDHGPARLALEVLHPGPHSDTQPETGHSSRYDRGPGCRGSDGVAEGRGVHNGGGRGPRGRHRGAVGRRPAIGSLEVLCQHLNRPADAPLHGAGKTRVLRGHVLLLEPVQLVQLLPDTLRLLAVDQTHPQTALVLLEPVSDGPVPCGLDPSLPHLDMPRQLLVELAVPQEQGGLDVDELGSDQPFIDLLLRQLALVGFDVGVAQRTPLVELDGVYRLRSASDALIDLIGGVVQQGLSLPLLEAGEDFIVRVPGGAGLHDAVLIGRVPQGQKVLVYGGALPGGLLKLPAFMW